MRTIEPKVQSIKRAKLNEKKSSRKKLSQILGYHVRLSSFSKIFDNAFPFVTISCWEFKPDVLVKWKALIMLKKFPFTNFP